MGEHLKFTSHTGAAVTRTLFSDPIRYKIKSIQLNNNLVILKNFMLKED